MAGSHKGSAYEREICVLLSKWWSNGKSDDIFWRTPGSGARATTRKKKNKESLGCGDIQATNPKGQPLIDMFSIELKRGYSTSTFADLMEPSTTANAKPCQYEKFIHQACADHINSGSQSWMLIVKRNRKKAIIIIPFVTYKKLKEITKIALNKPPCFHLNCNLQTEQLRIFGCTLERFLSMVQPKDIIKLAVKYKQGKPSYHKRIGKAKNPKSKKQLDKEAPVYRCVNCDEDEVRINEAGEYSCGNCRSVFRDCPG